MARLGFRPMCRMALAMLVCPVRRSRLMARLRRLAIILGPPPVRAREGILAHRHITDPVQFVLCDTRSRMRVDSQIGGRVVPDV
jgi:hypothetical protein